MSPERNPDCSCTTADELGLPEDFVDPTVIAYYDPTCSVHRRKTAEPEPMECQCIPVEHLLFLRDDPHLVIEPGTFAYEDPNCRMHREKTTAGKSVTERGGEA